jgi:hypothetical protein
LTSFRDALYFMQDYVVGLTGAVSETSKTFVTGLSRLTQKETGADQTSYPDYVDPGLEPAAELLGF